VNANPAVDGRVTNPLVDAATVFVTGVGGAEGSRGAAAALACMGAEVDLATLLVDVGGRPPRPTLLASAAAQALEERLAAHLPRARVAARGQVCHLAVPADGDGMEAASAAVAVARGALAVLRLSPPMFREALEEGAGLSLSGVLLRADVAASRPLLALLVRDLMARELAVAVLKQRINWVVERRALFGALSSDALSGGPAIQLRRLLSHGCYASSDDPAIDPKGAAQPERGDHAGIGPR
jgi:hypothetical protein